MSESLRSKWIEVVDLTYIREAGDVPQPPIDKEYIDVHSLDLSSDNDVQEAMCAFYGPGSAAYQFRRVVLVNPEDIRNMRRVIVDTGAGGSVVEGTIFSLRGHDNIPQNGAPPTMTEFLLPVSARVFTNHLLSDNPAHRELHWAYRGKLLPSPDVYIRP